MTGSEHRLTKAQAEVKLLLARDRLADERGLFLLFVTREMAQRHSEVMET